MTGIRRDLVERVRRAFGLSGYEARVYVAMLMGARNPREVSTVSGVPLPRVYDIVRLLEAKGLVEREPDGWFAPVPPRAAAAAVIAREEEELRRRARLAAEVVEELEEIAGSTGRPKVSVVQGVGGLAALLSQAIAPGSTVYVTMGPGWERLAGALVASIRAAGVGEVRVLGREDPRLPPGVYTFCRTDLVAVDSVVGGEAVIISFWDAETDSVTAVAVRGWYARRYYAVVEEAWRRCVEGTQS